MEEKKPVFFIFCLFFCCTLHFLISLFPTGTQVVQGSSHHHNHHKHHHLHRPSKLFVFGDSYADTGNTRKSISDSEAWKVPYGTTFPGKQAGRFSDGRVFTDYLASFLGIKSPIPYTWRKYAVKSLRYGMNFAYGGSGVFDTLFPYPNMTTQIDFFQQLIHDGVYTKSDLNSSVAHVSVVGNDYNTYVRRNGTTQGFLVFAQSVVNQISFNLKRIHGLGVKKLVITALQPLGCLPRNTVSSSYQQCDATDNSAANLHNLFLQQAVQKLNNETKDSAFGILNFYGGFMDAFKTKGNDSGGLKFKNPLKPCCMGVSSKYKCGAVDKNGEKKYTECKNPNSTFFWDQDHPTQEGWIAIYSVLQASFDQLY